MGTLPDLILEKQYVIFLQGDARNYWKVIPKLRQDISLTRISRVIAASENTIVHEILVIDAENNLYEIRLQGDVTRMVYVLEAEVPGSNGIGTGANGLHDTLREHQRCRSKHELLAAQTDARVPCLRGYEKSKQQLFVHQTEKQGAWLVFGPEEQDAVAIAARTGNRIDFGADFVNNAVKDNNGLVWDSDRTWNIENWCSLADVLIAYRGVRAPAFAIFRIHYEIPNHKGALMSSQPILCEDKHTNTQ